MNGLCECGCGERTNIAQQSITSKGIVKGQSMRFITGHNKRSVNTEYITEDKGYETPCWIWQRAVRQGGYGVAWDGEKLVGAHRWVYERRYGTIPPGLSLDHLCRIPTCVNPEHLEPVTHEVNTRRGARARLKPWQVRAMRRAREETELSGRQLAKAFCISERQAYTILAGQQWRGV